MPHKLQSASPAYKVAHRDFLPTEDREDMEAQRGQRSCLRPHSTGKEIFQTPKPISSLPCSPASLSHEPQNKHGNLTLLGEAPTRWVLGQFDCSTCEASSWERPSVRILRLLLPIQPRDHVWLREREFCPEEVTQVGSTAQISPL